MKKLTVFVLVATFIIVFFTGCGDLDSGSSSENSNSSTATSNEPIDDGWKVVYEFNGTFENNKTEASSAVFELSGGQVRITGEIGVTSTGGNALIYVLPEGWTKTADADGNLKISSQDLMIIGVEEGAKSGEEIVEKEAGKYFIDLNSASVKDYKIKIEEKK